MKYKRQYDLFEADFEVNNGDYIVDTSNYESLEDLLARCVRDMRPVPDHTPGLVEDYEVTDDFILSDKSDKVLFPEDYQIENIQPVDQTVNDCQNNFSEQNEPPSVAPEGE